MPRVLEGAIENYLGVAYTDPMLTRTVGAAEAISAHDVLTEAQFGRGHFGLMGYTQTTIVALHVLCSVPALREQLTFPRADREARARLAARTNIVRSWAAGIDPHLGHYYGTSCLVLDVLSPLLTILAPAIKPAAMQLLASDERAALYGLVDRFISLGLRFAQMRSDDDGGSYAYRLDPPLAELLPPSPAAAEGGGADGADGSGVAGRRELPAAVKQLLSAEVQREQLRRQHHAKTGGGGAADGAAGGGAGGGSGTPGRSSAATSATPAVKPVPKPIAKPVVAETKPVEKRDMFGRVITNAQKRKRSGLAAGGAAGGGADGASPAGAADRLPNVRFKPRGRHRRRPADGAGTRPALMICVWGGRVWKRRRRRLAVCGGRRPPSAAFFCGLLLRPRPRRVVGRAASAQEGDLCACVERERCERAGEGSARGAGFLARVLRAIRRLRSAATACWVRGSSRLPHHMQRWMCARNTGTSRMESIVCGVARGGGGGLDGGWGAGGGSDRHRRVLFALVIECERFVCAGRLFGGWYYGIVECARSRLLLLARLSLLEEGERVF